jgi:transposase
MKICSVCLEVRGESIPVSEGNCPNCGSFLRAQILWSLWVGLVLVSCGFFLWEVWVR